MKNIFVLTGAGISQESGLNTFRGPDGLWEGHRVEDVATYEGFVRDPDLVYRFYNERRAKLKEPTIQPNQAHVALAEFEEKFPGEFNLVTQNVDNLHDRAGSKNLLHIHGELNKVRCMICEEIQNWVSDLTHQHRCSVCASGLRPHIVWFGETPFYMDAIMKMLRETDLFISIGTSGNVYPAAGFVRMVPPRCRTVEINLDSTATSPNFQEHVFGRATEAVPKFLNSLSF